MLVSIDPDATLTDDQQVITTVSELRNVIGELISDRDDCSLDQTFQETDEIIKEHFKVSR